MILTCNNCHSQLNHSLSCIPAEWRDPIVYSLCKLYESPSRHCEVDYSFYLCDLPQKWRDELVHLICRAFSIEACNMTCQQCNTLFINELLSFPEEWRKKIIIIVCDIINTKGCPPVECVTYFITPFVGIDTTYPYSYTDCYGDRQEGTISITDTVTICAVKGSVVIDSRFTVIQVDDECNLEDSPCQCLTIINVEWDIPHVIPHEMSYEDCDEGVVITVNMEGQISIQICGKISSIVTNFNYSAISSGICIGGCVETSCFYYLAKNTSEDETVIFSYEECGNEQPTVVTLEGGESTIFCSISAVISGSINLEVTQIGNC